MPRPLEIPLFEGGSHAPHAGKMSGLDLNQETFAALAPARRRRVVRSQTPMPRKESAGVSRPVRQEQPPPEVSLEPLELASPASPPPSLAVAGSAVDPEGSHRCMHSP